MKQSDLSEVSNSIKISLTNSNRDSDTMTDPVSNLNDSIFDEANDFKGDADELFGSRVGSKSQRKSTSNNKISEANLEDYL